MDAAVVMLIVSVWGVTAALAVRGAIAIWKSKDQGKAAIVEPGPKGDHEQRLVKLEYKFHALELEWEDTRAKFLGMTRSFIRQAKAAGLDSTAHLASQTDGNSADPSTAEERLAGVLSSRAAVLKRWRGNATRKS